MHLRYPDAIDAIELSNWDFWRKSPEEREGLLRCCVKSARLLSLRKARPAFRYRERASGLRRPVWL